MIKYLGYIVILISISACKTAQVSLNNPTEIQYLVQQKDLDKWSVQISIDHPVDALKFTRQVNLIRHQNWKVITPGITLGVINKKEILYRPDGLPFKEVSFEFDSFFETTPKDYEFFKKFTDGSVLMYTGHFNACPSYYPLKSVHSPDNLVLQESCTGERIFKFKSSKNQEIIILGSVYKNGEANWVDDKGRGTYVYFGKLKPIETPYILAVLDPGIPSGRLCFHSYPRLRSFQ